MPVKSSPVWDQKEKISYLMKRVCLEEFVGMTFQKDSLASNMVNGKHNEIYIKAIIWTKSMQTFLSCLKHIIRRYQISK